MCALAFGYGGTAIGWNGLWVVVVADLAPPHREASAVGIGLTLVNLASAPGPRLLGAVYSLSGSSRIMWLLLGLLLACSLPAALLVFGPRAAARKDVKPKAYARQPGTGQAGSPVSGGPDDQ